MYKGKKKFTKKQLVFVVEAILVSALDRIESGMPTSITWAERLNHVNKIDPSAKTLTAYDRGALEAAGMMLGVLYAQLCPDDGLGIYNALACAGDFHGVIDSWVSRAWHDEGKVVMRRIRDMGRRPYNIQEVYTNYPDCHKHAVEFVDQVFSDYLEGRHAPAEST